MSGCGREMRRSLFRLLSSASLMTAQPHSASAEPGDDAGAHMAAFTRAERLVDAFEAGRRQRAAADATEIRVLARAAASVATPARPTPEQVRRAELDRRALIADLATSSHVSEWTVTRLLSESADLCRRFEVGVAALARGDISRQHLGAIHDTGAAITGDAARAEFLGIALERATELTPGRLTSVLRVIAERFLDRTLDERAAEAATRRDVEVVDLADNLAALTLTAEATLIHGIEDRLSAQAISVIDAREPGDEGDTRTRAQIKADIVTDLLLTAGPDRCVAGEGLEAIRATVQVTLPVLTMTGASDEPCLLAGYGPIDPDTARALAAGAPGWERVMTSPVTGAVLAVDRYRPGKRLNRFLAARDERCRFPGCRQPVWRCDIDHTVDHQHGGPTESCNLAHLCRRHHTMKHHTAWTVEQISPGVLVWTSPTGRKHTDRPEAVVRFVVDDEVERRRRIMREPWLFTDYGPPDSADFPPF
jgi:hypothetical protein